MPPSGPGGFVDFCDLKRGEFFHPSSSRSPSAGTCGLPVTISDRAINVGRLSRTTAYIDRAREAVRTQVYAGEHTFFSSAVLSVASPTNVSALASVQWTLPQWAYRISAPTGLFRFRLL
jgi:hypothetical protein